MSSAPGIDVGIGSSRCEELLRDCLASWFANPPDGELTVRVVDNASGDGTVEMVRREFPQGELTVNDDNEGFSRANNPALARSGAPYAFVVTPDARMTPGALLRLVDLMEERHGIGGSGPRLELEDGRFDH